MVAPLDQKLFPFDPPIAARVQPHEYTFIGRLWGPFMISLGLALTLVWLALIGYGLVILFEQSL